MSPVLIALPPLGKSNGHKSVADYLSDAAASREWQGLGFGAGGFQVRNPIPLKIRRVWGLLHAKSYVVAKRPPVGVSWKFREGSASSAVVLVI
ncbi:hypothetical protein AVEN_37432-1 [Araneus ventricosus]|uniref:Uncharacterized protein n=1 Tax=Araneus ventricosus TaxID=182803 RepID=A0A4Y2FCA8_ARAVE|nr:hypothetical protein AVEN_37432-1 [Araneus ventricosus]